MGEAAAVGPAAELLEPVATRQAVTAGLAAQADSAATAGWAATAG